MDARVGRDCANSLRIVYADDPDTMQAGQGLQHFPLIAEALGKPSTIQYWMMSPAEQVALAFLLGQLRPKVAIEIGTRFDGSLQAAFPLFRSCQDLFAKIPDSSSRVLL
jgi:hypothetical protein